MKRNKNLIELSRDHHHGLLLGWKIKQGLKKNVPLDEIANYVEHFSTTALFPHFLEEENQVLIYLDAGDTYRERTIREHSQIKELVARISDPVSVDKEHLLNLAQSLEAHIRFEERELFPYIETQLSSEELDAMGVLISDLHHPYIETYSNEFWAI